ncbi:MAG: thioredoxin family protein [Burkholderiaceae bacterium]
MRPLPRFRSLALPLVLGLASWAAQAASVAFDKSAFDAAVRAGKPTAVQFHADWCPTCKAQAPVVAALLAEPQFKDLTLFIADYDKESALKKDLKVTQQSTFVVFKAGKEVGRSTGQTSKAAVAEVLGKAL